jgi:hypothetical protein
MARTVVSSREVYHLWANQVQDSARNSSNSVSFCGKSAYSYRAEIARIVQHKGKTAVLFADRSWSITTSGHQSAIRRASSHLPTLCALDLDRTPGEQRNYFAERIREHTVKTATARRGASQAKWLRELEFWISKANAYCTFYGLRPFVLPADFNAELARIKEQEAKLAKKREKESAAKREKQEREFQEQKALASVQLRKWMDGEEFDETGIDSPSWTPERCARYFSGDFMRVEGEEVVTTQGVRVSSKLVRRAARFIVPHVHLGTAWIANGEQCNVGGYHVRSIAADGTVQIGCHTFDRGEVLRMASVLGVEPKSVPDKSAPV